VNVLIYTSFITEQCLKRRASEQYRSFAGQKKILMLARALESLGHTVDICSTSYAKTIDRAFTEDLSPRVRAIHAPTLGLFGKTSFFKKTVGTAFNIYWLVRHYRKYQLVIFYNFHVEFSVPALMAKRLFELKIVMDYEDGLFNDKGYQGGFYRLLEKTVYREANGFVVVNMGLKERIHLFCREEKPFVVINGFLDTQLLAQNRVRKMGSVQKVAFTGNFNRGFGFDELLQYINHWPEGFTLMITGRAGPQEEGILHDRVKDLPNICFKGYLDTNEFEALLKGVDVFMLLNNPDSDSNKTNFPSKLFDYLSRNCLVLSTPNPVLKPYYLLRNFVLLKDFPDDLKRLKEMCESQAPDANELFSLHDDILRSLEGFLEEVICCDGFT
jgi:hypothetical protein